MACLGSSLVMFVPRPFWFSGWLGLTGAWQVKKKKLHIVFLQWVPVAMRQAECHLVQAVFNLYSPHTALHVRFMLYQEATLLTSCRTVGRSMYRRLCSGACCGCAHVGTLARPFFVAACMGHLCGTGRQKGPTVVFLGVGWYCQATC